ncbi:hypothetical protein CO037_01990 [Candidatus Pacearchaeota archaeon CG_4_9_14_0_2_um_filter_30_8]|nr:MAG: hypothetical protein CO037_01990 [Candidatus Pacearchaeota archaeon CG_4_9_14_0_2_um_filter_30_8]
MSDKIEIKKDTFFKGTIAVLGILLIISIFTGGFGFGANAGGGNAVVNDNGGNAAQPVSMKVLEDTSLYPALGPSDAKATVVEFIDFQCPFCGMASGLVPWIEQAKGQYGSLVDSAKNAKELAQQGKVRYVVVAMSFLGQESVYAAQAGLCANKQGKFFEMEDLIYSAQTQGENTGKFNKDKLEIIAKDIKGLDQTKFKNCLENDETLGDVQKIASTASQFAQGTPTFYVNGQKVSASWSAIQSAINAA